MITHVMKVDEAYLSHDNIRNKTCIDNDVEINSVVHCLLRLKNESIISKWCDQGINSLIVKDIADAIIHRHFTSIAHAITGIEPETTGIPMNFTPSMPSH